MHVYTLEVFLFWSVCSQQTDLCLRGDDAYLFISSSCLRRRFDTPLLFSLAACGSHALRCLFVCLQSACVRWARGATTTFFHNATPKHQNNVSIFLVSWHGAWEGGSKLSLLSPEKIMSFSLCMVHLGKMQNNVMKLERPERIFVWKFICRGEFLWEDFFNNMLATTFV